MFVGILLIVVSCTLCGYCFSIELANREKNLRWFKNFVIYMQSEITYKITPVSSAIKRFYTDKTLDESENNVMENVLKSYVDSDTEIVSLFVENKDDIAFNNADLNVVKDFFEQLGKTDLNSQKGLFEVTLNRLEECINDAKEIYAQKGKLFKVLGTGVGIIIALLLV